MAIFFSLSQPDGLVEGGRLGYKPDTGGAHSTLNMHMCAKPCLHKDCISFHHLRRAVEWKAIESVDQVFIQDVQVLHFLH